MKSTDFIDVKTIIDFTNVINFLEATDLIDF